MPAGFRCGHEFLCAVLRKQTSRRQPPHDAARGILPANDARVIGTVKAIETHLVENGFVGRYTQDPAVDGLPCGEGTFLPCSFWLADNYELQGRHEDAVRLFERLLDVRNDVGLLAEEYDPTAKRLLGNFPQAFSHVGLVNTAFNLTGRSIAESFTTEGTKVHEGNA